MNNNNSFAPFGLQAAETNGSFNYGYSHPGIPFMPPNYAAWTNYRSENHSQYGTTESAVNLQAGGAVVGPFGFGDSYVGGEFRPQNFVALPASHRPENQSHFGATGSAGHHTRESFGGFNFGALQSTGFTFNPASAANYQERSENQPHFETPGFVGHQVRNSYGVLNFGVPHPESQFRFNPVFVAHYQKRPENRSHFRKSRSADVVNQQNLPEAGGNHSSTALSLPHCIICYDKERNIVFLPCGHLLVCSNCANLKMTTCPLCRQSITQEIKTYIS